jgi:protein-S-isoprenylcysteine O-methyltransferase Ste14
MNNYLNHLLPVYITAYFLLAFVLKSLIVAKKIGKSPLVLPNDDTAYGLVGKYFKLMMIVLFIYVFSYSYFPKCQTYLFPFSFRKNEILQYIGIAILAIAFIWTLIAQNHMKQSWRIGIDLNTKTELITEGVFKISRNPIFLGMMMCLIGLILICQNAIMLFLLIVSYILIQVQVRLEEQYLFQQHDKDFIYYKSNVRRYI